MQPEKAGKRLCQRRFANTGQVFDEQVPARQKARQRQANLCVLAKNDLIGGSQHVGNWRNFV